MVAWRKLQGAGGFGGTGPVEYVANSVDSDRTVTYPSGIQSGDLLIANVFGVGITLQGGAPTGWTILNASFDEVYLVMYRWADGTETGTVTLSDDTNCDGASITVFRNVLHFEWQEKISTGATSTFTVTQPPIDAADSSFVVFCGTQSSSDSWTSSDLTERFDVAVGSNRLCCFSEEGMSVQVATTATLTNSNTSGNNFGYGLLMWPTSASAPTVPSVRAIYSDEINNGDLTLYKPAGTVENDQLLIVVRHGGSSAPDPPSGWTIAESATVSGNSWAVFTKTAGASEPSSYTVQKFGVETEGIIICIKDASAVSVSAGGSTDNYFSGPDAVSGNSNFVVYIGVHEYNDDLNAGATLDGLEVIWDSEDYYTHQVRLGLLVATSHEAMCENGNGRGQRFDRGNNFSLLDRVSLVYEP